MGSMPLTGPYILVFFTPVQKVRPDASGRLFSWGKEFENDPVPFLQCVSKFVSGQATA